MISACFFIAGHRTALRACLEIFPFTKFSKRIEIQCGGILKFDKNLFEKRGWNPTVVFDNLTVSNYLIG